MVRSLRAFLLVGSLALFTPARAPCQGSTPGEEPQWLAVDDLAGGDTLTRSITVTAVQSARLRFAGDFCRTHIAINGQPIADIQPYCPTQTLDVTDAVRLGPNRLELTPEAVPGAPAVVAATLTVMQADGSNVSFSTDGNWQVTTKSGGSRAAKPRGPVPAELWGIHRRGIAIDRFENYEQWRQASGAGSASPRFFAAEGFEISQLRVAGPDEGSWVSLAADEQGRLTIAREDQGFLRMTLAGDSKSVTHTEAITADLAECRGLVYREGWLYASANKSKTLFRLKLGEDGQVTDLTPLREFSGTFGHGRNDLFLSGDSLLLICGDAVDPQTADIFNRTSPLRKPVAGKYVNEGSLLRTSITSRKWELLCGGLRNPYGIATHPETGDPFTYDADNEYDLGMPWYRPTRVLQLLAGGDFGYRKATDLPPRFSDQPDNAPPLIDIGRGSPTAVIFGNELRFPAPYRDALFVLDWTYGRVIAVHLAPRGASFRASTELFLQGKPLNVTDVAAGRDGAMYLITGGRKTQSALFRVSTKAASDKYDTASTETAFRKEIREYAQRNREVARRFRTTDPKESPPQWQSSMPFLDAPDPVVRYAARTALEKHDSSEWGPAILNLSGGNTSLRGLMAIARVLDPGLSPVIVDRLASIPIAKLPIDQRLVWLRILELCLTANSDAVVAKRAALVPIMIAGWQASLSPPQQVSIEGTNADYRRRAALLLQTLGSTELTELAVRDLLSSSVQEDQVAGLMALRNQGAGWTAKGRELQLQILAAMPRMVGGEGLPTFHAWLERETSAGLSPSDHADYSARKAALSEPEPLPPTRPFVRKWTLDELRGIAADSTVGDAGHGEGVFRDALCARCHRFGSLGRSVGPDLTLVAGRFSRHDMLDSILNPSKAVAEDYRSVTIQTTDGKVLTGRLVPGGDFRSEKIQLVPDSLRPDQFVEIDKKSIESHQQSDISPMPQSLLDTFTREDITDLLAFLTMRKVAVAPSR